jgi:hypothetical protein
MQSNRTDIMPPKRKSMPKRKRASKKKSSTLQLNKEEIESTPNGQTNSSPSEEQKEQTNTSYVTLNEGPQQEFIDAPEREVLYGGAAGGGKSFALLIDPLRYCQHADHSALILRRTNDELRELIHKSTELYPKFYRGAKWSERKSQWTFPSGARIWLTYLEQDKDVLRYQGQSFSYVGFDELTQYPTAFPWDYLRSRLRSTNPEIKVYMRATTNPGGPGHSWVKKMFIDPATPNKSFWARDPETKEILRYPKGHSKAGEPLFQRRFIPASLKDNPYLYNQGDYETMLLSLPEVQRKQLLYGSWDIAEGAAFTEFDRKTHVIEPYEIPSGWRKFRACDYGYGSYSAVLWFAVTPDDTLVVYRELYVRKVLAVELARIILNLESQDGKMAYGVLDSSCWHKRGDTGPSLAEQMILEGCKFRPSDRSRGSRVSGKNEIHRLLRVDEDTDMAGIQIFNTCTNLIAQLPILPLDKRNPEDIDTHAEDHLYDALRYGIQSRPVPRNIFDLDPSTSAKEQFKPADAVFGY